MCSELHSVTDIGPLRRRGHRAVRFVATMKVQVGGTTFLV
jgi:hypothetical protein